MLQYRLSVIRNITATMTFGKPAMSVCGADGYSEKLGFMASNHLRVQAVRDMAQQAEKVIVVTESCKFDRTSTVPLALPGGVYGVITDSVITP